MITVPSTSMAMACSVGMNEARASDFENKFLPLASLMVLLSRLDTDGDGAT